MIVPDPISKLGIVRKSKSERWVMMYINKEC